jgi:hypothetical protein
MDPDSDPGGPKTYGSNGSGSATVLFYMIIHSLVSWSGNPVGNGFAYVCAATRTVDFRADTVKCLNWFT